MLSRPALSRYLSCGWSGPASVGTSSLICCSICSPRSLKNVSGSSICANLSGRCVCQWLRAWAPYGFIGCLLDRGVDCCPQNIERQLLRLLVSSVCHRAVPPFSTRGSVVGGEPVTGGR